MAKGAKGTDVLGAAQDADGKATLTRFVSMLSKLGQRNREVGAMLGLVAGSMRTTVATTTTIGPRIDEVLVTECWIPRR
jgi:hypothetical protein